MHICLITGIFPPDIGGPATYVSRLARALREEQHEVTVITLGDDATVYPFPVKRISRAHPLPLRLLLLFFAFLRYGRTSAVWYINGLELPAVLAGKLLRKRMVMKIVGDYAWERAMNGGLTTDSIDAFQQKPQGWKVELHKQMRAWSARQVHQVITPSRYLKQIVCGWGVPENRVQVVYNAVEDLPKNLGSKARIRAQLGIPDDARVLVTVARLVPWKGLDQVIRLLPHLEPAVQLWIVGDGPQKNKLTDLVEDLRLLSRVKFLGKCDRLTTLGYMRAADLFVLNTGYEGFSHVLLEAMMVGTPVMTTPVCGNPELVRHQENGLLVDAEDVDSLAIQMTHLLEDSALQSQLIAGGKQAIDHYSWNRLLRNTLEILCAFGA